jgi:hypothetical protein
MTVKHSVCSAIKPSYKNIMKGFTTTIAKLERLAAFNADLVEDNDAKISKLEHENHELEKEGSMALNTMLKLRELIGE